MSDPVDVPESAAHGQPSRREESAHGLVHLNEVVSLTGTRHHNVPRLHILFGTIDDDLAFALDDEPELILVVVVTLESSALERDCEAPSRGKG